MTPHVEKGALWGILWSSPAARSLLALLGLLKGPQALAYSIIRGFYHVCMVFLAVLSPYRDYYERPS